MVMGLKDGQEMKIIDDNLAWFRRKIEFNQSVSDKIQKDLNKAGKTKVAVQNLLKGFYWKLLKLGVLPRETGLSWLIRKLRTMGEMVTTKNLPDFLDLKAKAFLLKRATNKQKILEEQTLFEVTSEIYTYRLMQVREARHLQHQEAKEMIELLDDSFNFSGETSLALQHIDNEDEREK